MWKLSLCLTKYKFCECQVFGIQQTHKSRWLAYSRLSLNLYTMNVLVLYIWLLQMHYLIQYPILGYWFTMLRSSQPHIWLGANIFSDFLTSRFPTMPHFKMWKEDRYTTYLENFLHIKSHYQIKFIRDSVSSVMAEDKWIKLSLMEKIMNLVIHREAA